MKKAIYLLALLIPFFAVVACSDDEKGKDIPNVEFTFDIDGAVQSGNALYAVQGSTIQIKAITVTNLDSKKEAFITGASYYWDMFYLGSTVTPPYGYEIITDEDTPLGEHEIEIECPVYAVDKSPAQAMLTISVNIVASDEDLPAEAEPATPTTVAPHITDAK